jgi:bleomycin hydrolase
MSRTRTAALVLLASAAALSLSAQYVPGPGEGPSPDAALTPQLTRSIEDSFTLTPELKAVQNALAANELNALVTDHAKLIADDTLFTHVIKDTGAITSQEQTGRCWLFAGLNILRPGAMKKYGMENFELSQAYDQFWDKMERANRTLELAIALKDEPADSRKNWTLLTKPIEDGGDWNYVLYLVDKYGVVPKSVMPDTWSASHTDPMNALLSSLMRKGILAIRQEAAKGADLAKLRELKAGTLKEVYRVLALCLGEPPKEFTWRYEDKDHKVSEPKTYTPQSFYKDFLGAGLNNYVRFVNYPGKPLHTPLRFAWNRDSADGPDMQALNVTTEEMKKAAMASVLADEAVWFCCDSSVQRDAKAGLWDQGIQDYNDLFGLDFTMDKGDALAMLERMPDHCMVFVGVDVRGGRPAKWKVENSWGDKRGREGYFTITDSWFDANVYEMLLNRKYATPEQLKAMDEEPYVLPPWDPFTY